MITIRALVSFARGSLLPVPGLLLAATLAGCTGGDAQYRFDYDGDGVADADDCAPEDASIFPGNAEVCGDGIDNDCSGEADDLDADFDGHLAGECGGDDCDDSRATVHPERYEECGDGLDNDCSGVVDDRDADGDSYVDEDCGGDDCDDADPFSDPGAPEQADERDNDCDGTVDEGTPLSDDDGDGVSVGEGDCDDTDPDIHPGAPEDGGAGDGMGNGIDDDCDGIVDDGTLDHDDDFDGYSELDGDCDDTTPAVGPGVFETCDGVDQDCDGVVDDRDVDGDGHVDEACTEYDGGEGGDDCDDLHPAVYPGAAELPDTVDNDCDGAVDEGTYLADDDGDGYAEADGDCDDTDAGAYPGAVEVCGNGVDEDCSYVADDLDGDGDGVLAAACDGPDCDDGDDQVHPGAADPYGDGADTDCDGSDGIDFDGDGYPSNAELEQDPIYDCNDANPLVYPGAPDAVGNNRDDDCDGVDGVDADGDGYAGEDSGGDDCDDADPGISPGEPEIPDNGIDENCDGSDGTGCVDNDGDGECESTDCDDADPDQNHNDDDEDGYTSCPGPVQDCDDLDDTVHPSAPDICDGVLDNDCDGVTDPLEDDADGDGSSECEGDCDDADAWLNPDDADFDGYSTCDGECDDGDATLNPGMAEVCDDLIENDCDGATDCTDIDCAGVPHCPLSGYVTLPAGVFTMGSPPGEVGRSSNETQHQVTLTGAFEIGVTEVTQGQFAGVTGWDPPASYGCYGCGTDYPVYYVSWFDCAAFANEVSLDAGLVPCYDLANVQCEDGTSVGTSYLGCLNATQGGIDAADVSFGGGAATPYECEGYRLPTEAEWEYAARSAGVVADSYPAGGNLLAGDESDCNGNLQLDDGSYLDDQAWYCGNQSGQSEPVGGLLSNPVGLYDMSGNLWEWNHDWYQSSYGGDVTDPWGPSTGSYRVGRGGYWDNAPGDARVARRGYGSPGDRRFNIGCRLSRSSP